MNDLDPVVSDVLIAAGFAVELGKAMQEADDIIRSVCYPHDLGMAEWHAQRLASTLRKAARKAERMRDCFDRAKTRPP